MKKLGMILCGIAALSSANVNASVVESFDSGTWGSGWSNVNVGVVNTGAAHDGVYGVSLNSADWTYNTTLTASPGSTISAWIRPTSGSDGRLYLGFGADSTGAQSLVAATNSGDIRFQNNTGYNFVELNNSSQGWANHWYLLEINWLASGQATGNLYDADGTTLLNTLAQNGLPFGSGGLALRGFGGWDLDTLNVNSVPEPSSLLLAALGLAGLLSARSRKKA